jgi:TolB-like protein/DNA-binding winged helix-turn-helix (wHTH) protein/Flp pilus assembly protein TadD
MERGCNFREMWLTSEGADHRQLSGPHNRGAPRFQRVCSRVLHLPHSGVVVNDSSPSSPTLRFGVFELNPQSGELRKQGIKIRLQGQPVEILAMLLEHHGETITRDQLQKKLWPADTFVDFEQGLNNAMKRLRAALDDNAESPHFIETLPRRGYRFIASVEGVDRPSAPESAPVRKLRRAWRLLAVGALAVISAAVALVGLNLGGVRGRLFERPAGARIHSIAVLPLQNLSGDPQQEYFADGMTDELIAELAKISALRVISRTSVMQYKGVKKPLPQAAQELGVDAIVEGTVLRSGGRVRVTANLVQASPETHLWAESYERDLRDVLALQSDVATAIAREIQIKVSPQEQARLASSRPVNPDAYQLFLRGRYFWEKRTTADLKKAREYFGQAIEKEPTYALAYAGLADSYVLLSDYGALPSKQGFPQAKAAALKALQIDNTLAEAYPSLAWVRYSYDWDFPGAETDFKRAIELNSNYATAHHWYGWYLALMGRFDEGFAELKKAQELDPLSLVISTNLGRVLYFAHRYDEALQQYRRTLDMDPNFVKAHNELGWAYEQKGMHADAVAGWLKAKTLSGENDVGVAKLKKAYRESGMRDYWQEELELAKEELTHGHVWPAGWVARIYVHLGNKKAALEWLERGFKERDGSLVYLKAEPDFDPLRSDPSFQNLMRRIGLPP